MELKMFFMSAAWFVGSMATGWGICAFRGVDVPFLPGRGKGGK